LYVIFVFVSAALALTNYFRSKPI